MKTIIEPCRALVVLLWLIALHSFLVGVGLIVFSPEILAVFGFDVKEKFFSSQGGVFHIVLCMVYVGAIKTLKHNYLLVYIAIAAKMIATVFLLSYYFFMSPIWVVVYSGLGDFMMGIALIIILNKCKSAQ